MGDSFANVADMSRAEIEAWQPGKDFRTKFLCASVSSEPEFVTARKSAGEPEQFRHRITQASTAVCG
jgi:hypothetical protein